MIDAGCVLNVCVVRQLRVRLAYRHGRAAADVVHELGRPVDGPKSQPRHQLVVERDALLEPSRPKHHMGDAVDLHADPLAPGVKSPGIVLAPGAHEELLPRLEPCPQFGRSEPLRRDGAPAKVPQIDVVQR